MSDDLVFLAHVLIVGIFNIAVLSIAFISTPDDEKNHFLVGVFATAMVIAAFTGVVFHR